MELLGKTNIDFIGKRKISFIISSIIAIMGIIAIIQMARGAATLGIDFAGGTAMQLKFDKPLDIADARKALHKNGVPKFDLQEVRDGNKLLIKIDRNVSVELGQSADVVRNAFAKEFPDNSFAVESSTEIGPSIGDQLRRDTLVAATISMLGILLYIAWRFDFKFGVGATLATVHDCLAMFAVFLILDKEINLLFITAVLTVAGYSLTDTVVVFDRIRENMRKNAKDEMAVVFNRSINEVLSRTIITALTTLIATLSLFIFGGEAIHDFSLAFIIGIVVGTYSSIFVASPIAILLEERSTRARLRKA